MGYTRRYKTRLTPIQNAFSLQRKSLYTPIHRTRFWCRTEDTASSSSAALRRPRTVISICTLTMMLMLSMTTSSTTIRDWNNSCSGTSTMRLLEGRHRLPKGRSIPPQNLRLLKIRWWRTFIQSCMNSQSLRSIWKKMTPRRWKHREFKMK